MTGAGFCSEARHVKTRDEQALGNTDVYLSLKKMEIILLFNHKTKAMETMHLENVNTVNGTTAIGGNEFCGKGPALIDLD